MLRSTGFFLTWIFALSVYYGALFPAISDLVEQLEKNMTASGPLAGGLLDTLLETIVLWMPLLMTAGVIIILFVSATGRRGTSGVRP